MYCGDASLVNNETRIGTAVPLLCHCWTCEECAPGRKRQVQALGLAGRPNTLITLTAGPGAGNTPPAAARTLALSWRRIRRELVEKKGKRAPPFLAVFEATKKARPHLHILSRVDWIAQAWLSARMKALARSPIVDIRRIYNARMAAAYVAKYLSKDPIRFQGSKRYWTSQDWIIDPIGNDTPVMDTAEGWRADRRSLPTLGADLRNQGYSVEFHADRMEFSWPWPGRPPYEREAFSVRE